MNRLLDKLAILMLCMVAFGMDTQETFPVAAVLLCVAVSALIQMQTKAAPWLIAGSALLCGAEPLFLCALPLLVYDAMQERKWWLILPSLIGSIHIGRLLPMQILLTAAGTVTAIVLCRRVTALEDAVGRITAMRDTATEQNLNLSAQNLRLAEAQDNELHLAPLRERNRIAREIHDNVGHLLTRSLLQSGALLVVNKDEQLAEPLMELRATLDNAMTSIRKSVHDLHDDSIDLRKVIAESVRTAEGRFHVQFTYDMGDTVPGKIRLCMAGIVKESLSNVMKHSNGDTVRIILREHPGFYQLMVEDNGCCGRIQNTGIGLQNMEDRARAVGGIIRFTPSDKGFSVFMSINKSQTIGEDI